LLFLPAFWWHQVSAPGVSVSVNFWWSPQLRQIMEAHNAMRTLPQFYAKDRLKSFRQTLLSRATLDFMMAAELFLRRGRTWGAGVMALAAFDEWIGEEARPLGVERPAGCWLRELPDDLRHAAAQAFESGGAHSAYRQYVDRAALLAAAVARRYGDAHI